MPSRLASGCCEAMSASVCGVAIRATRTPRSATSRRSSATWIPGRSSTAILAWVAAATAAETSSRSSVPEKP